MFTHLRPPGPITAVVLAAAGALLAVGVPVAASDEHAATAGAHWTYEGDEGPSHWGDLDPAFGICRQGHLQSPIDIPVASLPAEHLAPLRFQYKPSPLHVADNGHTETIPCAAGSVIRIGPSEYELQQVHFHRPSEETIDGKSFALVAHLVHKDKAGRLAVVAVLFEEGARNPALAQVFSHLPPKAGEEEAPAGVRFNPAAMLPANRSYVTFEGSLTTPPCSEGVTWYVLRTPVTIGTEQLAAFARHYPHNNRPVQPRAGRALHASE